nr:hypothetical protein BaRGS_022574 [Batillaria attramentaria]
MKGDKSTFGSIFHAGALALYYLNPNDHNVTFDLPQFSGQKLQLYILTAGLFVYGRKCFSSIFNPNRPCKEGERCGDGHGTCHSWNQCICDEGYFRCTGKNFAKHGECVKAFFTDSPDCVDGKKACSMGLGVCDGHTCSCINGTYVRPHYKACVSTVFENPNSGCHCFTVQPCDA